MHSKVKTATSYVRQVTSSTNEILPDLERHLTTKLPLNGHRAAHHTDEYLPDDEIYLNRHLPYESYQTLNIEPKQLERVSHVSGHVPIIPVCCGGGLASLALLKTTLGVVLNNKQSYAREIVSKICIMKH